MEVSYAARLASIAAQLDRIGTALVTGNRDAWTRSDGRLGVQDAQPPKFSEMVRRARETAKRAVAAVAPKYARDVAARMRLHVNGQVATELEPVIGVDISLAFAADSELAPAMARAVADNVALINSIPEQYFDLIEQAVTDHWTAGLRWESLADRIAEIGKITRNRALLIAQDQTSKQNAAFNEARQTSVGIEEYDWDDSHDKRVRPPHRAMRGRRCRWASPPLVEGEHVHPGQAVRCRCLALPRFDTARAAGAAAQALEAEERRAA